MRPSEILIQVKAEDVVSDGGYLKPESMLDVIVDTDDGRFDVVAIHGHDPKSFHYMDINLALLSEIVDKHISLMNKKG